MLVHTTQTHLAASSPQGFLWPTIGTEDRPQGSPDGVKVIPCGWILSVTFSHPDCNRRPWHRTRSVNSPM